MIQVSIIKYLNAVSFEMCHSQSAVESADGYQKPQKAVSIGAQKVNYFRPPKVKYLAARNGLP